MTPHKPLGPTYIPVIPLSSRVILYAATVLWCAFVIMFAAFWLRDTHIVSLGRFIFNSILIVWNLVLPPYFLWYAARMRRIDPETPVPALRTAMVVTKTPSESWAIVKSTLQAALDQPVPHDVWLLDEVPVAEAHNWCKTNGVHIATRNGHPQYNNANWPRKTRTKEGNLAHFYETVGYDRYDIVCQLDADHAPHNGYLKHILRAFTDPRVGYVAAPNLGDVNLKTSWAARARLYGESVMNGSLQSAYTADGAPICIGSHYAVRTKALRESGGIGPELAEDYTTTVMMQAAGWRGAFAYDAVANGYGPETFVDLIVQDYQWAKTMTRVLLGFLPSRLFKLRVQTWPRFLLSVLWYPLLSLSMACGLLVPMIAVATQIPMVRVSYVYYLLFGLPTVLIPALSFLWLRNRGWLRPVTMKLISWETILFQFARWPWTLLGTLAGAWEILTNRSYSFVVTPKGLQRPAPGILLAPYAVIVALVALTMYLFPSAGEATGYHLFLMVIGAAYVVLLGALVWLERDLLGLGQLRLRLALAGASAALVLFTAAPIAAPAATLAFQDAVEIPGQAYYALIGRFAVAEDTFSPNIATPTPAPDIWTVSEGEHLWGIAVRVYGNGLRWTDIRGSNTPLLYAHSPTGTIIWPGDILQLPR